MINNEVNIVEGAYTEGFDTFVSGMVVTMTNGSIHFAYPTMKEAQEVINGQTVTTYVNGFNKEDFTFTGFSFDVIPDDELLVVYDVYLCADNTVEVERTEIGGEQLAFYSGTKELLHCMCTFIVPPNCTSLDGVKITVRHLQNKVVAK